MFSREASFGNEGRVGSCGACRCKRMRRVRNEIHTDARPVFNPHGSSDPANSFVQLAFYFGSSPSSGSCSMTGRAGAIRR
jgi:hypothetical protein